MAFNALGFALASAITRDMKDRDRAAQLSLVGAFTGDVADIALASALTRSMSDRTRPGTASRWRDLTVRVIALDARGPTAIGALAVGAAALGAVAIGRLAIGRAAIKRLEIDELQVRHLRVLDLEVVSERRRAAEGEGAAPG